MTSKFSLVFSATLAIALLGYLFVDSLVFLFGHWTGSEDYSHGLFVPLISLFLIWQARHRIAEAGVAQSWWGLSMTAAGLLLYVIGEFSTLYILQHVSFWVAFVGLIIALIGICGVRAANGAVVRIASLVDPGETKDLVDQRLIRFVSTIEPELVRYVPD